MFELAKMKSIKFRSTKGKSLFPQAISNIPQILRLRRFKNRKVMKNNVKQEINLNEKKNDSDKLDGLAILDASAVSAIPVNDDELQHFRSIQIYMQATSFERSQILVDCIPFNFET
ncbi:hypothetical protein HK096_011567 [Nowakowskiella sp. JEL0078]|nr:hypothetical protein HK096_011567 [Nowakowskiella sp. JEL0078]